MFAVCVDRESGRILLNRKLFENAKPEPLGNDVNGYGSPSPAVEEGRVYIHFGSYGTACLDTKSYKVLWQRRDLPCRHYRGPSSSVVLFRNLVILTLDGADQQYTVALDKRTGKTIWKTARRADWNDLDERGQPFMEGDMRKAHSTPILVEANGRTLLISAGAKAAHAYDARTGREVWRLNHKGFSASFRPVAGHGLVFLPTSYGRNEVVAVRYDTVGDIGEEKVAWRYSRMTPSKPSPALVGDWLFFVNDSGVVTCLAAKTGEVIWQERIGGTFSSSPVVSENRIYLCSELGKTIVLKPAAKLEILAESQLDGGFMASPAIAGKSLFLRTRTHLYRIEQKG